MTSFLKTSLLALALMSTAALASPPAATAEQGIAGVTLGAPWSETVKTLKLANVKCTPAKVPLTDAPASYCHFSYTGMPTLALRALNREAAVLMQDDQVILVAATVPVGANPDDALVQSWLNALARATGLTLTVDNGEALLSASQEDALAMGRDAFLQSPTMGVRPNPKTNTLEVTLGSFALNLFVSESRKP